MSERQPRIRKEPEPRHTQFSEVTIAAWTSEVNGAHLYIPKSSYGHGSTSGILNLLTRLQFKIKTEL